MTYTIRQLADLAGVSVRTLHHYDNIGLLSPTRANKNGYRTYGEEDLLKLQQILFFRELEFPLEDIKRILSSPGFDIRAALGDQRNLLQLRKKRLGKLIATIDNTLKKLNKEMTMTDKDLYGGFTKEEMDVYAEEARQRWGHTEAFKQSQERTKHWTKEDYARLKEDADKWMKHLAAHMHHAPESPIVQQLIDQHYNSLRTFYEPSPELYRGLAEMYITDERFTAYFERYATGLAQFMHDAMMSYVDKKGA